MLGSIKAFLNSWNRSRNERQKLQHTYLAGAAGIAVVSGLISLINNELGKDLVKISLIAVLAFLANAVVWSLLNSAVLIKLDNQPKTTPKNQTKR